MIAKTNTIGKSEIRKDAWAKVSGNTLYVADISERGLRHGKILRSPHHHARILKIDTVAAHCVPGVIAVLTSHDIPGSSTFGPLVQDRQVLARDVVRHMGEPVVLVVAETKSIADRAAKTISIQYDPLPAIFDPLEALQPGAPKVHPQGNLLTEYDVSNGDLQAGFDQAEIILEETFSVPRISPAYLEMEASLARWNNDGTLTVWVSSQKPFEDRHSIAQVLNLPEDCILVKGAVIGGAFGGKEDSSIAILAALAAWASRSTVRLENNRRESFLAHPKRHPARISARLGAKQDGTLTALEAVIYLDTGAYASYGPAVGGLLTEVVPGAYRVPSVRVNTKVVYTNSPFSGAMRGFGSPQAHFATESLMDMLAVRLKMDPIELRRKNILKPGDRLFTQVVVDNSAESLPPCLEHASAAVERLRRIPSSPKKVSGVGVALCTQSMGLGNRVPDDSTNRLEWLPDGRVLLYIGSPDLGQGLSTVAEQIVAETLGIPFEAVHTIDVDTHKSPYGGVTCASRMTYLIGNSVILAAMKLIASVLDFASRRLNLPWGVLSYDQGLVRLPGGDTIPVVEFIGRAREDGVVISGEATFSFPYPPETTPQHLPIGMPHVKFCYGAQVVRVEVDAELGTVEVTDVVAIHDVGRVINQVGIEGQIEGGVAMGIGYTLYENVKLKDDDSWVESFTEYLIPTTKDVPSNIESIILEVPDLSGPYGAKGVAEMSTVPTAPAIANAVYDAAKVRVTALPISPEKVVRINTSY